MLRIASLTRWSTSATLAAVGVFSIILGVLSILGALLSIPAGVLPYGALVLSIGSTIMALVGIVLGGMSLSRAKRDGESTGSPTAGIVVSVIGFVLALGATLTCGLCNAACSKAVIDAARDGGLRFERGGDGGFTFNSGPQPLEQLPEPPGTPDPNNPDPTNLAPTEPNAPPAPGAVETIDPAGGGPRPAPPVGSGSGNQAIVDPFAPPPAMPPPAMPKPQN